MNRYHKNNLEELNQQVCKLTTEQINSLSEDEILSMAMERPGHPGQYGFMLQLPYFKSSEHLAKTKVRCSIFIWELKHE